MAALGFDEKFAAQTFYPFCWGVATFCLSYSIVKEVAMYISYSIGIIALSIYNNELLYTSTRQRRKSFQPAIMIRAAVLV
jgi:hypothetical protein